MPRVEVTNSKGLVQYAGTGPSDLSSGLGMGTQTVAAAGANQGAATAISSSAGGLVLVTGADGTKGVRLPSLSSVPFGTMFMIVNTVAGQTLKVYPATGDKVNPLTDNTTVVVAASSMLICVAADDTQWVGAEPAVVSGP